MGQLGDAAKFIENTLATFVPMLLDFLARLLRLGNVSEKIKKILQRVRKPIDDLIEKIMRFIKNKIKGFGKKGKKKKETKDQTKKDMKKDKGKDGVTDVDRKKHKQYGEEIKAELTEKSNKPTFEEFYKEKKRKAKALEKEYGKKTKQKIKVSISLETLEKAKKDQDIDARIRIVPNNYDEKVEITPKNFGDLDKIIEALKKSYQDILSIGKYVEVSGKQVFLPKYQDLLKELEVLKTFKTPTKANKHLDRIKEQVKIARKIQNVYRKKYKEQGHPITEDRTVAYGSYDIKISPWQGGVIKVIKGLLNPKKIQGKYNAISSGNTRTLENDSNASGNQEFMMPTQNEFLRYFKVRSENVHNARKSILNKDDHFPNPTHDAEAKLFEYLAQKIVEATVGVTTEEKEQELNFSKASNQITLDSKKSVKALKIKQELDSKSQQVSRREKDIKEQIKVIEEIASSNGIKFNGSLNEITVVAVQAQLKAMGNFQATKKKRGKVFLNFSAKRLEITQLEGEVQKLKEQIKPYKSGELDLSKNENWYDKDQRGIKKHLDEADTLNKNRKKKLDEAATKWLVRGKIIINDEQAACSSCQVIIKDFLKKFPHIKCDIIPSVGTFYGQKGKREKKFKV